MICNKLSLKMPRPCLVLKLIYTCSGENPKAQWS